MSTAGLTYASATPIGFSYTSDPAFAGDYIEGSARPYWSGWYKFTLTQNARVRLDSFQSYGSGNDTVLKLWQGATEGSATLVAENDDADPENDNYLSQIVADLAPGSYVIQLGTWGAGDDEMYLVLHGTANSLVDGVEGGEIVQGVLKVLTEEGWAIA